MSEQETAPRPSRSAYAEAAAWLAQLHGSGRDVGLEADFRAWLKAGSGEHARAFERVTEIWDAAGDASLRGVAHAAVPDVFEKRPSHWPLAVAALLLLGVLGWCLLLFLPRHLEYATAAGEQRSVRLADGTRLSLNTDSAVEVDYGPHRRSVRLAQGEVLFEVAHDAQRPFVVTAGNRTVTALGTSFVVRKEPDRFDVTLLEGKVSVASLAPASGVQSADETQDAITLKPGQRLHVRAGEPPRLDSRGTEAAIAWNRGEVILDDTPLDEAVAEMNRYDPHRLEFDDADLRKLRVSGIYRTGNNRDFARSLASIYGFKVIDEANRIRLTKR